MATDELDDLLTKAMAILDRIRTLLRQQKQQKEETQDQHHQCVWHEDTTGFGG